MASIIIYTKKITLLFEHLPKRLPPLKIHKGVQTDVKKSKWGDN